MDVDAIVAAGLDVVHEAGFDKLSMRAVATRLGVHVGGLYYYVPDRAALLQNMADVICRDVSTSLDAAPRPPAWPDAAAQLCDHLRAALLTRRDAARVLASGPLNGSLGALELMERLLTVLDEGLSPDDATVAADALMSYVTGYTLQQQMPAGTAPMDVDELVRRVPRVMRGTRVAEDELFARSVSAILTGFGAG